MTSDTWREIAQQPETWIETAALVARHAELLKPLFADARAIVLTGSGSSEYAGACAAPHFQRHLDVGATAVGAGAILIDPRQALPPIRPLLLVSLARSGDSPESSGVVDLLLETEPEVRHLLITCNRQGRLAARYAGQPRVTVLTLADRTCDRSLVMTSSFTNLTLAAHLSMDPDLAVAVRLGAAAHRILADNAHLAHLAGTPFRRAVFLGSGARHAAARESALKMLEMTAGRVIAIAETWLGLRHGPMSAIDAETLIVGFVSDTEPARSYELDVLRTLERKGLGAATHLVPPPDSSGDDPPLLEVVSGQLLAYHRCLAEGLDPDRPSPQGVITRVVEDFSIHRHGGTS